MIETMEDFIHLHVHTYYSILDGQSPVKALVDKAIADGMRGMAITDHGNMFGVKELFDYCKGINKDRKKEGRSLLNRFSAVRCMCRRMAASH